MSNGVVHITTREPPVPPDADFALYIDFVRGEGDPARVFRAAEAMIRAFQQLDHALVGTIDNRIEPSLVLEEIQSGSLKVWLRNVLKATDDDALKTLDWKPAVGKYLVRAKYVYIEWANQSDKDASLLELAKRMAAIASETDIKRLPDYRPPSVRELADATVEVEAAKALLIPGDRMAYLPAQKVGLPAPIDFDLTIKWEKQDLLALATKETMRFEKMPMNLIVKRPDYLGTSMWDFRHGKVALSAKLADEPWLHKFQDRQVDVRPGDALKCLVTIERSYGFDNELVDETYVVTKVEDVLPSQLTSQANLWDDEAR